MKSHTMASSTMWFCVFLFVIIFCILRVIIGLLSYLLDCRQTQRYRFRHRLEQEDRQANIFTIADDSIGSNSANRFADFFYLEPTSEEAARIRAQLEKDDRELPTYDDVMRINNVIVPTTLAARPADTSRNTTIDILPLPLSLPPVPPYSEIDPNAILSAEPSTTFGSTSTADCYSVATTSAMCSVTPQSTSVPSTLTDVAMEYTTMTTTTAATTSSAIAGNVPINNIAAIV